MAILKELGIAESLSVLIEGVCMCVHVCVRLHACLCACVCAERLNDASSHVYVCACVCGCVCVHTGESLLNGVPSCLAYVCACVYFVCVFRVSYMCVLCV